MSNNKNQIQKSVIQQILNNKDSIMQEEDEEDYYNNAFDQDGGVSNKNKTIEIKSQKSE